MKITMGTCDGAGGPGPGDEDTAPARQPEESQDKTGDAPEPGEWPRFDITK